MKDSIQINNDFKEFAELLEKNKVKYLIIGGFAVNFHGYPRYTKDIDIWLMVDPSNIDNFLKTLKEFGFESLGLNEKDFSDKDNIIQLGYEPNRIDILVSVDGLEFQKTYENRLDYKYDDICLNFISIDDLIIAKQTSGRPQDLADADILLKIKNRSKQSI